MLVKLYGSPSNEEQRRYSPSRCTGVQEIPIFGDPDPAHINTSYVEWQNLIMRMGMRLFTRLTSAFSKRIENLTHAVSLHFMHYNFVRIHQTLGTTPAVAAGVADHAWTIRGIVELLEAKEHPQPKPAEEEPEAPAAGVQAN